MGNFYGDNKGNGNSVEVIITKTSQQEISDMYSNQRRGWAVGYLMLL